MRNRQIHRTKWPLVLESHTVIRDPHRETRVKVTVENEFLQRLVHVRRRRTHDRSRNAATNPIWVNTIYGVSHAEFFALVISHRNNGIFWTCCEWNGTSCNGCQPDDTIMFQIFYHGCPNLRIRPKRHGDFRVEAVLNPLLHNCTRMNYSVVNYSLVGTA